MNAGRIRRFLGLGAALVLCLLLLVACGQSETAIEAPATEAAPPTAVAEPTIAPEPTAEEPPTEAAPAIEESAGESPLVRVEATDGPPFYARFGENETFGDAEQVAIIFYRSPDCIPAEFDLNAFFDFPGESGPGAFGCQPPTTDVVEYWAGAPGSGPAPKVSEMTGRGAVPVWFFARSDIDAANSDGVVTIGELAALESRRVGTATTYTELLHPSQSNAQSLIQFLAEGTLEDGGEFLVDVSYGDPDVSDHTTIEIE